MRKRNSIVNDITVAKYTSNSFPELVFLDDLTLLWSEFGIFLACSLAKKKKQPPETGKQ